MRLPWCAIGGRGRATLREGTTGAWLRRYAALELHMRRRRSTLPRRSTVLSSAPAAVHTSLCEAPASALPDTDSRASQRPTQGRLLVLAAQHLPAASQSSLSRTSSERNHHLSPRPAAPADARLPPAPADCSGCPWIVWATGMSAHRRLPDLVRR